MVAVAGNVGHRAKEANMTTDNDAAWARNRASRA
jgi:hypothetical protein